MLEYRKGKPKRSQCKIRMKNIFSIIDELEESLIKSQYTDRQILMAVKLDHLKNQSVTTELKEAQKENSQLLNTLWVNNANMSRAIPNTTSTMSLVQMHYKYEDLLDSHNGLLRLLDARSADTRRYREENDRLKEEIETLKTKLLNSEDDISKLQGKIKDIRLRKSCKILKLRTERDTLRLVHNRLITLLNKLCSEQDDLLAEHLMNAKDPERALLIQEIRKNNLLYYENFQLRQKIEYLQSLLKIKT